MSIKTEAVAAYNARTNYNNEEWTNIRGWIVSKFPHVYAPAIYKAAQKGEVKCEIKNILKSNILAYISANNAAISEEKIQRLAFEKESKLVTALKNYLESEGLSVTVVDMKLIVSGWAPTEVVK